MGLSHCASVEIEPFRLLCITLRVQWSHLSHTEPRTLTCPTDTVVKEHTLQLQSGSLDNGC